MFDTLKCFINDICLASRTSNNTSAQRDSIMSLIVKQFNGNKILSSVEFVSLFRKYDKDGMCIYIYIRTIWIYNTDIFCRTPTQLTLTYLINVFRCLFFRRIGNGFIEAGELDSFLKDLCEELGPEVRLMIKLYSDVHILK